jgi:hypothetical protein
LTSAFGTFRTCCDGPGIGERAEKPSGKDDEFYHQAKKELQEVLDRENQRRRE